MIGFGIPFAAIFGLIGAIIDFFKFRNKNSIVQSKERVDTHNTNETNYADTLESETEPMEENKDSKQVHDHAISQELYAKAYNEIETDHKKDSLWAMVYATTASEDEAKKKYINLRVEELHEEELIQKQAEEKEAKAERRKERRQIEALRAERLRKEKEAEQLRKNEE